MPTGVHPAGLTVGVSIYDEGAPCHQAPQPSYMLTLPQLWPTKTPWACRMPSGACNRKQGNSRIQLPTMHPQPELTDGLSATACFQMSAQLQSQISSCQTIMGWQSRCHLPMHPPAAQGFGQCLLPSFPQPPMGAGLHVQHGLWTAGSQMGQHDAPEYHSYSCFQRLAVS